MSKFSEYINSQADELQKAGDGYEALSELSKNCIDYAVERYSKQKAIAFFKWNAMQASEYLDYLRRVDKAEGASEREQELNRFENATIETRYKIFTQHLESQNKGQ